MREPHYRIVVADARTKRDGRAIETIGEYHPKNDPSVIRVDGERADAARPLRRRPEGLGAERVAHSVHDRQLEVRRAVAGVVRLQPVVGQAFALGH